MKFNKDSYWKMVRCWICMLFFPLISLLFVNFVLADDIPELEKAPYLIYEGQNSEMKILWQLNSTLSCLLEWGTDTSYSTGFVSTNEVNSGHQHNYTIPGLIPGSLYCYRVNINGEYITGTFRTSPQEDSNNLKFLVFGDTRSNPFYLDKLCMQMNSVINDDPECQTFLLHAGDWVSSDDESDWENEFFDASYSNTINSLANIPFLGCMGNHELPGNIYDKYWPYPYVNSHYWSFTSGPVHVIIIDQYIDYTNGSAQYTWIENELINSTKRWKFILMHEPGWSAGTHSNDSDVQTYIQPLCETYGVDMVFAGHNHNYAHSKVNGVHHITTGGGGAPPHVVNTGNPNVVSAYSTRHFCKIDIQGDYLYFQAVNDDGEVFDEFSVVKNLDDETPPSIPQNFVVSNLLAISVLLDWDDSSDNHSVFGYRVYRNGVQVGTATDSAYMDSGLVPNTPYSYSVKAFDTTGNESAFSDVLAVTTNSYDSWFGGTGIEIGYENLDSGYEPSGLVWHERLDALFVAGDDGNVTWMEPDGTVLANWWPGGDIEGITIVDPDSNYVYVGLERPYPYNRILEFDISTGLLTGRQWVLSEWMGDPNDPNAGLEALTFVPDGYHPYPPGISGGLFYAGLEKDGKIYVFDIDIEGTYVGHVDTITVFSGWNGITGLNFESKTGILHAVFRNRSSYVKMEPDGTVLGVYTLPGNNQEGIGISEKGVVFIAEDSGPEVWRFDGSPPSISNVKATAVDKNSAMIYWITGEPSDSKVEYGQDLSYGNETFRDSAKRLVHCVPVTGLNVGTEYHFKIISSDKDGFSSESGDYTFPTAQDLGSVTVSTSEELNVAVENANLGGPNEILIEDGTYVVDGYLHIISDDITVKSLSGNRESVILQGHGMYSEDTSHIFFVSGKNFIVKDMTLRDVRYHAIQLDLDVDGVLMRNLHILDTFEQMVKIPYDLENMSLKSENGIMENCLLEYSSGIGPQYYIGGIDGHNCLNWIVRNNIFKGIRSPSEDVAEHAIHFWSDSENTLVERNLIVNCDRGIGFGLGDRGHVGGIIRNNMIYHNSSGGFADVGIGLESASGVKVYNNTVYMEQSYPNAIEYRFSETSGVLIANNLTNKDIALRDGASGTLSNNVTNAQQSWFNNVSSGDLNLTSDVSAVVDQGAYVDGLFDDYEGNSRPLGFGYDIGADEYATGGSRDITPPSTPENLYANVISLQNIELQWSSFNQIM
ncbi:MAG: metallophosphoesterase [Candidatus Theseobacter exili]|nr:metallophosphoesterase [Candidatus Theseobacter exili]